MSLGPLMLGIEGLALTHEERGLLRHPLVGGVILFARNYESPPQLQDLTADIHGLRAPHLLVAVDQEGGRVQRFRDGFTRLPAVRTLGQLYDSKPARALRMARISGWLMASELRAVGVDFSFAPVLDLDHGVSGVIGDRAFHRNPEIVADLASAYVAGMRRAGMSATAKHFPGHGAVAEDSHHTLPLDPRPYERIAADDLLPFARLCPRRVAAVMPAHVVYSAVDQRPAGFSRRWIQQVLRGRLGFQGLVFSDDLDMSAAGFAGEPQERARAALEAGCDMALACNDRAAALRILECLGPYDNAVAHLRLVRMHGRGGMSLGELRRSLGWRKAVQLIQSYEESPLLDMDM